MVVFNNEVVILQKPNNKVSGYVLIYLGDIYVGDFIYIAVYAGVSSVSMSVSVPMLMLMSMSAIYIRVIACAGVM